MNVEHIRQHTQEVYWDLRDMPELMRSHWKQVGIQTPALWTTISLTATQNSLGDMNSRFQRHGQGPLNVLLSLHMERKAELKQLQKEILCGLRNHLRQDRVRALVIDLESLYPESVFPILFPEGEVFNLNNLAALYCGPVIWAKQRQPPILPLARLHAPHLKSLIVPPGIGYIVRSFASIRENNPFPRLEAMSIGFNYPVATRDLAAISQCSELRSLDWCANYSDGRPLPKSLPFNFNFHHLQSLSLLLVTEESCLAVSSRFYTPVLEELRLNMFNDADEDSGLVGQIDWIRPFLRRNSQLKTLVIENAEAYANMLDVFGYLIHLTALTMVLCVVSKPFMNTFLETVNGRLILPSLRHFEFRSSPPFSTLLLEIAKSRLTDNEATCPKILLLINRDKRYTPRECLDELDSLAQRYHRLRLTCAIQVDPTPPLRGDSTYL